jgi:hypothetical protein
MARGGWVYIGGRAGNKPPAGEKSVITAACEKFIAEVLMPRFLPRIRPTKFNYPIAIYGKWHGNKYRFIDSAAGFESTSCMVGCNSEDLACRAEPR